MIEVGARGEEKITVTDEIAISFLGVENARVLSTPNMIGHMEGTCRNLVLPMLEPGHDTVGTHVNVYHLGASPMGMEVTFRAEITAVDGRRIQFRVEAFDSSEKIGEGTHERTVIDVARFTEKMRAKFGAAK